MLFNIIKSGAVVNALVIIIGTVFGLLLKKGIPARVSDNLMHGISLCVLFIAISGLIVSDINILVVVISMAIGAVIGELIDLDGLLNKFSDSVQAKISKGGESKFSEGFVTATLVFCVGAMSVIGSIESGIKGDNATLYSKSLIDAITSVIFASSFGFGVMFSAIPILILEGGLTLLASYLAPVLSERIVAHMSVVGSLLILALSLNLLKITKIKIMNLLPAVFLPIGLCLFM